MSMGTQTIKRARMRRCVVFLSFFGTEHVDNCIRCLVPYGDRHAFSLVPDGDTKRY